MDIITYLANELPSKRANHVTKQLAYLGLDPGRTIKDSKKKICQYYLDNHLQELLLYYQMGKRVVDPENKQGLTTMVNKLAGKWDLLDSEGNHVPATVTKSYSELQKLYSNIKVA